MLPLKSGTKRERGARPEFLLTLDGFQLYSAASAVPVQTRYDEA